LYNITMPFLQTVVWMLRRLCTRPWAWVIVGLALGVIPCQARLLPVALAIEGSRATALYRSWATVSAVLGCLIGLLLINDSRAVLGMLPIKPQVDVSAAAILAPTASLLLLMLGGVLLAEGRLPIDWDILLRSIALAAHVVSLGILFSGSLGTRWAGMLSLAAAVWLIPVSLLGSGLASRMLMPAVDVGRHMRLGEGPGSIRSLAPIAGLLLLVGLLRGRR
jgi:hypothetical protein